MRTALTLEGPNPRLTKDKLFVLLQWKGFDCSTSIVERILRRLEHEGVLRELMPNRISTRKRRGKRPHAVRKSKVRGRHTRGYRSGDTYSEIPEPKRGVL